MEPHRPPCAPAADGLSVVLACSEGEEATVAAIGAAARVAAQNGERFELILVEDGAPSEAIRRASRVALVAPFPLRVLVRPGPAARGAALRAGLQAAVHPWVLLADTSGQHDLGQVADLLAEAPGAEVVAGRRTTSFDPLGMRLRAALRRRIVRWASGVGLEDPECGLVLLRRATADALDLRADGPAFGAELLLAAGRRGVSLVRVPLRHHRPTAPTARAFTLLDDLSEAFGLRRFRDRAPRARLSPPPMVARPP